MKNLARGCFAALAIALFSFVLPAQAELAFGRDYVIIEPALLSDDATKIEVIEFFSYACPHCSDLAPHIAKWAAKLPPDVVFKRVASPGNPYWLLMTKLYYALEALGELPRLDDAVFTAIHVKGLQLIDEKSIATWVVSQGVDAKKFSDAFNSFGVISRANRAGQMAHAAKISGVPALVIDGRYLITGKEVKTHDDLLALASQVIEMRRAERKKK